MFLYHRHTCRNTFEKYGKRFFASTSETIVSISSVVKVFKTLLSFTHHIFVTSPLFLTHLEVNLFPYTEKWMYRGGGIRTAGSKHEPADLKWVWVANVCTAVRTKLPGAYVINLTVIFHENSFFAHIGKRGMAVAREAEQVIKRLMAQSPSAPVCMANIAEQDTNPKLFFNASLEYKCLWMVNGKHLHRKSSEKSACMN